MLVALNGISIHRSLDSYSNIQQNSGGPVLQQFEDSSVFIRNNIILIMVFFVATEYAAEAMLV